MSLYDKRYLKKLEKKVREWETQVEGMKEKDMEFKSDSGVPINRLYTPLDIKDHDYIESLGFPGEVPFTRGVYPTMYRGQTWTMRLFSGHGTPEETNQRWKLLYEHGETGFSAAVDALTFNGLDPDDPRAEFEVGTTGVPLFCKQSMHALSEGLPIDKISVALVVEPFSSAPVCAMWFNMFQERGHDLKNCMGTCQNDILTMTVGYIPYQNVPPPKLLKLACDLIEWTVCMGNVPTFHPINFTGYNYRESGIDAVQELGFCFANAIAHIEELLKRGWSIDDFVDRLAFHLSAHKDFFEEVAKFRAARRIWYKLLKDNYGAKDPISYQFRFHIQTAGSSLSQYQPMINVVRTAYQALSAVLGGCQSMHTNSYDEAICLPSEEAVLLALRTQQVIEEETRIINTVDPLAGSYYVEWLTDKIEERVWGYLEKIKRAGGIVHALGSGWLYREMRDAFRKRQTNLESGMEKMISVNIYRMEEKKEPYVFRTNPRAAEIEKERLRKNREARNEKEVQELLVKLLETCRKDKNVMPVVMEATKAGASTGEVCNVYRQAWGIWNPPIVI